jgi:ssDNA-binding Zn-finger/Zn-ribbon topoisomerase 1
MGDDADYAMEQVEAEYAEQQDQFEPPEFEPAPKQKYKPIAVTGEEPCPRCGKPMRLRSGAYGQFMGCSGFPKCKGSRSLAGLATSSLSPQVIPVPMTPLTADEEVLAVLERLAKYHLKDGKTVLERVNPELRACVERYLPR